MSTDPDNILAPAGDTDRESKDDGVQEISPIQMWDKPTLKNNDADLYDFRPQVEVGDDLEDDDESGPKGSSVAGSALEDIYKTVATPAIVWKPSQETTVSVETDNGANSQSESGTQTSSQTQETSNGKSKPPA